MDVRWTAHEKVHEREREAIEKASEAVDQRLGTMNEMRVQIDRERGTYLIRETYDREHKALTETTDTRLKVLENGRSNDQGRLWMLGTGISAVFVLVQILLHFWKS